MSFWFLHCGANTLPARDIVLGHRGLNVKPISDVFCGGTKKSAFFVPLQGLLDLHHIAKDAHFIPAIIGNFPRAGLAAPRVGLFFRFNVIGIQPVVLRHIGDGFIMLSEFLASIFAVDKSAVCPDISPYESRNGAMFLSKATTMSLTFTL